MDLSPEETYALARPRGAAEPADAEAPAEPEDAGSGGSEARLAPGAGASAGASPPVPDPVDESYRTLVQRVTESLLRRTSLPTFEQWAEAYRERPDRFDAELLGFWKDAVEGDGEDG